MLHLSSSCTYYLYAGHADMRKSFDGLSGIIKSQLSLDAMSGAVFIFMNRRRTQVKLLLWEGVSHRATHYISGNLFQFWGSSVSIVSVLKRCIFSSTSLSQ